MAITLQGKESPQKTRMIEAVKFKENQAVKEDQFII